jgi:hypothetical protein
MLELTIFTILMQSKHPGAPLLIGAILGGGMYVFSLFRNSKSNKPPQDKKDTPDIIDVPIELQKKQNKTEKNVAHKPKLIKIEKSSDRF